MPAPTAASPSSSSRPRTSCASATAPPRPASTCRSCRASCRCRTSQAVNRDRGPVRLQGAAVVRQHVRRPRRRSRDAPHDRRHRGGRSLPPPAERGRRAVPLLHAEPRRSHLRDLPSAGSPPAMTREEKADAAARDRRGAHPGQGRALRLDDPELQARRGRLPRRPHLQPRPEGQQRPSEPDASRRRRRDLQRLSRRRRRHRGDQHVQLELDQPVRLRHHRHGARDQHRRGQADARLRRCRHGARPVQAALRRGRAGADQQDAVGVAQGQRSRLPRRHLRRGEGHVPRADRRPARRRRRFHPGRDGVRHAERQGSPRRRRRGGRGARRRSCP